MIGLGLLIPICSAFLFAKRPEVSSVTCPHCHRPLVAVEQVGAHELHFIHGSRRAHCLSRFDDPAERDRAFHRFSVCGLLKGRRYFFTA